MTEMSLDVVPADIRAKAEAVTGDVPQHVDYFAATDTVWHTLADGVQKVEIKTFNEGDRRRYLNKINSDVSMNARTKEIKMRAAAGDDLHTLLSVGITDWLVYQGDKPLPFSRHSLERALEAWPPTVIDDIAKAIRDQNDWLNGTEDDIEALEDEYRDLGERIGELKARQGK